MNLEKLLSSLFTVVGEAPKLNNEELKNKEWFEIRSAYGNTLDIYTTEDEARRKLKNNTHQLWKIQAGVRIRLI